MRPNISGRHNGHPPGDHNTTPSSLSASLPDSEFPSNRFEKQEFRR